jgi:hypothetical protein
MAWTIAKTWVTGELLTASDFNLYVRDNSRWLFEAASVTSEARPIEGLVGGTATVNTLYANQTFTLLAEEALVLLRYNAKWFFSSGSGITLGYANLSFPPSTSPKFSPFSALSSKADLNAHEQLTILGAWDVREPGAVQIGLGYRTSIATAVTEIGGGEMIVTMFPNAFT